MGLGREAPGGRRFGVRLPVDAAGVTLPVFLALFRAVIALRVGDEVDESFWGGGGSYSTVLVDTFRMCAARVGRWALIRTAATFGGEDLA